MTDYEVTTQDELNNALRQANSNDQIIVRSSDNIVISADQRTNARIIFAEKTYAIVYANITCAATDDAHVTLYDKAQTHANLSAQIVAYHSSIVYAFDRVTVDAFNTSSVHARDTSHISAHHNARVYADDHVRVYADGEARVHVNQYACVHAYDSVCVTAYCDSMVYIHDSNVTGSAGAHVAVRAYAFPNRIIGGHVLECSYDYYYNSADDWCKEYSVSVTGGVATLYKAVDKNLYAGRDYGQPTYYEIGTTVTCFDWVDNHKCGGGLHLSPTSFDAMKYRDESYDAIRILECHVLVSSIRVINDGANVPKCKVPAVYVVREVDQWMRPIDPPNATSDNASVTQ